MFQTHRTDVNYLFYIILTEQVLFNSIFKINRLLSMLLMDYVILCGSNQRKAFTSVICASNFFNKTFEEAKGGNHKFKLKNSRKYNGLPFEGQDLNC